MSDLLCGVEQRIFSITLNRIDKHNAFDEHLLQALQKNLDTAIADPKTKVILIKANGPHFSAGADLAWMQRMAQLNENENVEDALVLAKVMYTLYHSPKPTIAMVQGSAYGGGVGLVAACDTAIAASTARFCFSEVKLGLIPAVISPYVVKAIGERLSKHLFMTAESFDASEAKQYQLIHHCVAPADLNAFTLNYAQKIAQLPSQALAKCKTLVAQVANQTIDESLMHRTAQWIAGQRVSAEGQQGLRAFLNKETPNWK